MRRKRKRTRRALLAVITGLAVAGPLAAVPQVAAADTPVYLDPSYSPAERAADLVSRMTLEEKAAQLNSSQAPAIPRLGVRAYGWWNEAIHGVSREQTVDNDEPPDLVNTTSYPVSLSMGSTWNPELMHRVADQISSEAREVVRDNLLDLNFYSPTVNLSRDPRWGRNDETYSEDPVLTSRIASQYVNGMEGKDLNGQLRPESGGYLKTSTTLKHFAANNSEYNRTTGTSDMDERTLREYYLKQFESVIQQSDPASIMTSYNRVNGVPASASTHLMDELARKTFGFDGFFTSDCDSVYEIQHGHHWQPPGREEPLDHIERNAYANAAGVDLNCNRGLHDEHNFGNTLPTAVQQGVETEKGVYTEEFIDASLVRLFTVRIQLGEFDDPQQNPWVQQARARVPQGSWENSDANGAVTQTPERLALAREAAGEAIVLLRNSERPGGALLPLSVPDSGPFRVAVIGDQAATDDMYLGGYSSVQESSGKANNVNVHKGVQQAIQAINPQARVDHLPGSAADDPNEPNADSIAEAAQYDAVIVHATTDGETAREEKDREDLRLPGPQTELIKEVAARNPNTVVYLETVGQVDVTEFESAVPAILWSSYNGQRKGDAFADVLLGKRNPSGHLPFTWYREESQLPPIGDYRIRDGEGAPGRTYMYFDGPVSYPFGHGLSYTEFEYSNIQVDRHDANPDDVVTVTAQVTNTGQVAGSDVVQLYAATPDAPSSAERPDKRLVDFRKVTLQPNETKTVEFPVRVADLAFFNPESGKYEVDEGRYEFQLAASSADREVQQRAEVQVSGVLQPVLQTVSATPDEAGEQTHNDAAQVVFPSGAVVLPRLTVGMSDGTLYGHGQDADIPAGMTVEYRSNRPEVVSVDPDGTIRTRGAGVATVTAIVRHNGTERTTDFVIRVQEDHRR